MIQTAFQYNEESDGQHSYTLSMTSDKNKDKYADIEFFIDGQILVGKTNRVDPPEIEEVTEENIFSVIQELVEFMNES
jgi:hypothetical protein